MTLPKKNKDKNFYKKPSGSAQDMRLKEEVLHSCILIVDDVKLSREIISHFLKQVGFENLHFAVDGLDALKKVDILNPDMLILDIFMPNMDGFEVCKWIRAEDKFKDMPIMINTAMAETENRAKAFAVGVSDLLPKPVTPFELTAKVTMHLENRIILRGLKEYHTRLERDLDTARNMQSALVPTEEVLENIHQKFNLKIEQKYESSDELGGDFWGVDILDDERILVYIVDFAGHGVSAALNTFRFHSVMSQNRDITDPAEYMEKLNKILFRLLPVEQYATMFCGIIDTKRDKFIYSAAASTAPFIGEKNTENLEFLDPSGFPLGMIEDAAYETREVDFLKGQGLFLYSDVLTESMDQTGKMIEEVGFEAMCRDSLLHMGEGLGFLGRFLKIFDMHVVRPLKDDLTAVFIERQ